MLLKSQVAFAASALAMAVLFTGAASAETAEEAAAAFGAREDIMGISLSPDGNKVAYISAFGPSGEAVYVVDLEGRATPQRVLSNTDVATDISWCRWASDSRIVCGAWATNNATGMLLGFSRLFIFDSDGKNLEPLTTSASSRALGINQFGGSVLAFEIDGKPGKILMAREQIPESSMGTRLANTASGLSVDEVDVENLKIRKVEPANSEAIDYIADDSGRIRVMVRQPSNSRGNTGNQIHYSYRKMDSDSWVSLGTGIVDGQNLAGVDVVAVDAASNQAFVFDDINGFRTLQSISLDGSLKREVLLSRPDVDVDGLITIGRKGRVVGVSYATEKRLVEYFDPELKKLAADLANALPGTPQIGFAGASADESKLLIVASSDVDPGMTYLYNKETGQLESLLPVRPQMANRALGNMKPISFAASDGASIPGYLTLPAGVDNAKGLPAIVLPHGGPSARDEWGFDWLVQFFASRGYAVLQPNYRGSSGYGTAWFGKNGFQAWRTAVGDVNDAGRWLISQGIADPKKLAIVGWSYGGYAALQSPVLDTQLYKAIVGIAPVTDLEQLRQDARNYTSFPLINSFIGHGDHVRSGSPAKNAERITAPVLLVHGTYDRNVDVEQSRMMKRALESKGRSVRYLEFENLRHGLDDSDARQKMLIEIDGFLASNLGK